MTRRRLVALVSAAVLLTLCLLVLAAGLFLTRTSAGRDRIRAIIQPLAARRVHGSIYLGHIGGSFINSLTIDSIAIRDTRGELLVSTGPVRVTFDPRDIADQRLFVRSATIAHPYVHLIQHADGSWNFRDIFPEGPPQPTIQKELQSRSLLDYIVVDSATTRGGTFLLTMPWGPDDSLRGAARDSAIRAHLIDSTKAVTRTFDGYGRTYAWRNIAGLITHARLADPDSSKYGQEFDVANASVDEFEPTFSFRHLNATVRHVGDSVFFQVPHFEMPSSRGEGHGHVWWGNDHPVHYDIAIHGDSVSLADVHWVYPTLPTTGGGSLDLAIRNDPRNEHVIDFALSKMDVRSTKSHLTGAMSFGINEPVLLVRNVDLRADPVDFDLLRTLAGKPFPEDWQGRITGTVRGRGGPLTHFMVDDAHLTFDDAHVRGAVSRLSGSGELDILDPAFTAFHGFNVDAQTLDLRTIEYLFPDFPRLGGTVSGTATLDSSWLDVRFSNAHLVHQDGPGEPSQVSGSGRVTYGEPFMTYDLTLDAEPVSLTMLARSYPGLPLRGLASGPIRVRGQTPDLAVTASLEGAAGAVSFDGRLDIDSAGGYGVHGQGDLSGLNPATLLASSTIPASTLNGTYQADVTWTTPASVTGSAQLALERSTFDSVRVYPSVARVHFADGKMSVDSLLIRTEAATAWVGSGGIGLPGGTPDSLRLTVQVDSLGGLRPLLSHPVATRGHAAPPDSLSGALSLTTVARGTLDALDLRGDLSGSRLYFNKDRGDTLHVGFDLHDVLRAPSGTIAGRLDSVRLAGIAVDTVGGELRFTDKDHAHFVAGLEGRRGPLNGVIGGEWTRSGTGNGARDMFALDSLAMAIGRDRWRLAGAARLAADSTGLSLDSLVLRDDSAGVVTVAGTVPDAGEAIARIQASNVRVRDIAALFQDSATVNGVGRFSALVTGTRASPRVAVDVGTNRLLWGATEVDGVAGSLRYADSTITANLDVTRGGKPALHADARLPAVLTLFSAAKLYGRPLSGSLTAPSSDLSIVEGPLAKTVKDVKGQLNADVHAAGTWDAYSLTGTFNVSKASGFIVPLGVTLREGTARMSGFVNPATDRDSINVFMSAQSAGTPNGSATLTGFVLNPRSAVGDSIQLALGTRAFHVLDRRSLADLYLSTPLPRDSIRLVGTLNAPRLTGDSVVVDRGSIYLADADLARKQAVEFFIDTTATSTASVLPWIANFENNLRIDNVRVALGQDVRLRSAQANVRLDGQLRLAKAPTPASVLASGNAPLPVTLEGTLHTVSGTYNLDLGVVQREFTILSQGTVTFDGSPTTPRLDIRAQHDVRQARDRTLGVLVELTGRTSSPQLTFSTDAGYDISTSDILSYLLFGQPGLDLTGTGSNLPATEMIASVLAPTLSAVTTERLRQALGSSVDVFSFQLGAVPSQAGNAGIDFRQYLYNATIGAGTQVGKNLYVNVNTGLCQFQQGTMNPWGSLGGNVEYRIRSDLSVQAALDPATNRCSQQGQLFTGLQPTPMQFSFLLSHTWRF